MAGYLIAYDVTDNRVRAGMARQLAKAGVRLQKSVYFVDGSSRHVEKLERDLQKMLGEGDSLLVAPICRHCLNNARYYGPKPPTFALI